jgi:hypothetical protein
VRTCTVGWRRLSSQYRVCAGRAAPACRLEKKNTATRVRKLRCTPFFFCIVLLSEKGLKKNMWCDLMRLKQTRRKDATERVLIHLWSSRRHQPKQAISTNFQSTTKHTLHTQNTIVSKRTVHSTHQCTGQSVTKTITRTKNLGQDQLWTPDHENRRTELRESTAAGLVFPSTPRLLYKHQKHLSIFFMIINICTNLASAHDFCANIHMHVVKRWDSSFQ